MQGGRCQGDAKSPSALSSDRRYVEAPQAMQRRQELQAIDNRQELIAERLKQR